MAEPQDRFKPLNENASQKRDETADRMSNLKSPTVGLRADDDGTEEVISLLIEEIVKNKEIMQAQIDHITDLRRQLQETQDTLIETRNQRDIARQYNNNLRIHYHESAQLLSRYEKQYGQLMESAILKELKARVRAQEEHLNQLSLEKDYSKYAQMNRLDRKQTV